MNDRADRARMCRRLRKRNVAYGAGKRMPRHESRGGIAEVSADSVQGVRRCRRQRVGQSALRMQKPLRMH